MPLFTYIWRQMITKQEKIIAVETKVLTSFYLKRDVRVDFYIPGGFSDFNNLSLLLVNDGQDLVTMQFESILGKLMAENAIEPLFCVGIHCSTDRKNEYGTARILDYKGRGAKAYLYANFIMLELIPFIRKVYKVYSFREKCFAGFSLGALSALDIVWNYPTEFSKVGVFSGSLWWRDKDQDDEDFDEDIHRIMHRQVREGIFAPWLRFFFEVGALDEAVDRNNNGVIDAIDDTVSLIDELIAKGYHFRNDIAYLELKDGRHDVATWAYAFPYFLKWGWGVNTEVMG